MSDPQAHEPNESNPETATSAREPEYLFRLPDGDLIYVSTGSADDYETYYDSFRLFIGDATEMRDVPVTDVLRYRDGGTTMVMTAEETLFVPSPQRSDARPSWGDQDLEKLDPSGLEVSESATTVTFAGQVDRDRAPAAEEMPRRDVSRQRTHDVDRCQAIGERAPETPAREPDDGYGY